MLTSEINIYGVRGAWYITGTRILSTVREVNMLRISRSIFIAIVTTATLLHGCAKESSTEDRRREENERELSRLNLASGSYFGYVKVDEEKLVPLELELTPTRNPTNGDDNPELSAAMTIGLFGGITLSSRMTSFDWGSGKLSISFDRASSAGPSGMGGRGSVLELHGNLTDGEITNAAINGPNGGTRPVILAKNGPKLLTASEKYRYQISFSDSALLNDLTPQSSTTAQLSLKTLVTPRVAPATSDLPYLPPLEASLRFPGLAIVPQTATDVIYDPLDGFIELQLRSDSKIRIENVYLSQSVLTSGIDKWQPESIVTGSVIHSANMIGSAKIESGFPGIGLVEPMPLADLPPRYFKGTYKSEQNPVSFPMIASIDYINSQGVNSGEYPFAYFPKLRIKILICSGGRPFREGTYDMTALNPLDGTARLLDIRTGNSSGIDLRYLNDWSEIIGRFITSSTGAIDTRNPQIRMKPLEEGGATDCSGTLKR